jgi:hypothetical protein
MAWRELGFFGLPFEAVKSIAVTIEIAQPDLR